MRLVRLLAIVLLPLCSSAETIVLRSPRLVVMLETERGLPIAYTLSNGASIHGEDAGDSITATVFRREPRSFSKLTVRPASSQATGTSAGFVFTTPAATFTLHYELKDASLFVSLDNVTEQPGFELIDVATPDLATIREEDGPGWLAHGDGGGSTVTLADAKPGRLPENRFWGGVAGTLPVVMIGTRRALCVEEVQAFMDTTELSVSGEAGYRHAKLGTAMAYRVNGSLSYDMNMDPGKPRIFGNEKTPNLLVGQRPLCRLDFAGDVDRNGLVNWLDGAKLVRARMPEIPTHYYDDKLLYMIRNDEPKFPKPGATFEETAKIIREIAALTAYAPSDVYLWGWQYRGKDTGYPAVAEVNPRLGGYDGLRALISDARAWNATVSFSDNYDDAYKSSPAWDPAVIARRPDGELWESRNWTGETSYILGLAKYMAGPGPERIRYTCEHYGLKDTYLVDVLSYYAVRNDWDPEHAASGIKNLLDGRYKVLDEFRKCGLDVVSEELRYPFIGKIAVVDNGPAGETSPFGGDPIPLVATIYRRSAIWGFRGQAWRKTPEVYSLFYNGHEFPWYPSTTPDHIADFYYGMMVPWYQVHYRNIESFRREGARTLIGLEGNSRIEIDWSNFEYRVTVNGVLIARNGDTYCPIGKDRLAFYSKAGGKLSAPLPTAWKASEIVALALFADHSEPVKVSVAAARVTVTVSPGGPVMVFRNKAAVPKFL